MKNSNRCIKCGSDAVVVLDNSMGQQFTPVRISGFSVAKTARFICCDCGYMEEWIINEKRLERSLKRRISKDI